MKLKQYLKEQLDKTKPSDWFKVAALIVVVYCGVKLLMLFFMEYVISLILVAQYLKEHGKPAFLNQLPLVIRWTGYYIIGLLTALGAYFGIAPLTEDIFKAYKKHKTKRRVK